MLDFVQKISPSFDAGAEKRALAKALVPTADVGTLRLIQASCDSPDIREEAKAKENQLVSRRSIEELVLALGEANGWNPSDFSELDEYTDDQLFEWLQTAHEPYLLTILAEVIVRGQLESANNTGGRNIGIKFRKVFERLAKRSLLDQQRTVRAFSLVRRQMKQFGREVSPDICPPKAGVENPK